MNDDKIKILIKAILSSDVKDIEAQIRQLSKEIKEKIEIKLKINADDLDILSAKVNKDIKQIKDALKIDIPKVKLEGDFDKIKVALDNTDALKTATVNINNTLGKSADIMYKINKEGTKLEKIGTNITADSQKQYDLLMKRHIQQEKLLDQIDRVTRMNEPYIERAKLTDDYEKLQKTLLALDPAHKKFNSELDQAKLKFQQIGTELSVVKQKIQEGTKFTHIFGQSILDAGKKFMGWLLIGNIIMKVFSFFTFGIEALKDIDAELTELRKVTGETTEVMREYAFVANDVASKMGATTAEVIKQTVEWARLGYSIAEASKLAEESIVLALVGNMDIDRATTSLVSVLKAFNIEANNARLVIDQINEVGNRFAISQEDITKIMERSSAAMREAGNSLEEVIALGTSAQEIVQHAEKVGTALKTVSMRIRGVSEEGEDLTYLVPKLEEQFKEVGLTLKKDADTFKSTYEIISDLAGKWEELTDLQRADLLESVAGKHQGQIVAAMITNFEAAKDALETAKNAAGSATAEWERATESISYKTNRLTQTMTLFWQKLIDRDFIKMFIDTLNILFRILDTLVNNPLSGAIISIGTLTTAFGLAGLGIDRLIKKFIVFKQAGNAVKIGNIALNLSFVTLGASVRSLIEIIKVLTLTLMRNPLFLASTVVATGIYTISKAVNHFSKEIEKQREAVEKLNNEISSSTSEIERLQAIEQRTEAEEQHLKILEAQLEVQKQLKEIEDRKLVIKELFSFEHLTETETQIENMRHLQEEYARLSKEIEALDKVADRDIINKKYKESDIIWKDMLDTEKKLLEKQGKIRLLNVENMKFFSDLDNFAKGTVLNHLKAIEELTATMFSMNKETEEAKVSLESYAETSGRTTKELNEMVSVYQDLNSIIDAYNDSGQLSIENLIKLIDKYPEYIDRLLDEASVYDTLIELQELERANVEKSLNAKLESHAEYFNKVIKGNEDLWNQVKNAYGQDAENFRTIADVKLKIDETLRKVIGEGWSAFYGSTAEGLRGAIGLLSANLQRLPEAERKAASDRVMAMREQLSALESMQRSVSLPHVSLGKISTGSSGAKQTGASGKDYSAEVDRYTKINLELDRNNVMLQRNKVFQDLAKSDLEKKIELMKEEIELNKERQQSLHMLNEERRREMQELEGMLSDQGFVFQGVDDNRIIANLDNIKGKTKEVETLFKRYIELQSSLLPQASQEWWNLQANISGVGEEITNTIQTEIDKLDELNKELKNLNIEDKISDLSKQLDASKFSNWIENIILGLERFNDKSELLTFKLSLFDEEDYKNRVNIIIDLYEASQEKLQNYRGEFDRLSKITPKNTNEAQQLADAMRQVQQGMKDAFVATREYQRQFEKLQVDAISNEFKKANKQLELQLSIIDNNIKSLQDGILPDLTLDMVIPIPDFSDIFKKTQDENERIYNEQVELEDQIRTLKKQSLDMQLQDAENFYTTEMNKLMQHYMELINKIIEKEKKIAEIKKMLNEEQKRKLKITQEDIKTQIEKFDEYKSRAEKEHGKTIGEEKNKYYEQLLDDLKEKWKDPEKIIVESYQKALGSIVDDYLSGIQNSYSTVWGNIVRIVGNSVSSILSSVTQADTAITNVGLGGPSSNVVKVNPDGEAPRGLSVGTIVETAGGNYKIIKVNPDGSYESVKVYKDGTEGHPGGLAILGDEFKGAYEMAILPSGKTIIFGKHGKQMVNIPKGTQVIPHSETKELLSVVGNNKEIPSYAGGILGAIGSVVGTVVSTVVSTVGAAITGSSGKTSSGSSGSNTVKVNPDGKAPPGLSVGTVVETAGGDYKIIGVNSDGSYESVKLGTGGDLKASPVEPPPVKPPPVEPYLYQEPPPVIYNYDYVHNATPTESSLYDKIGIDIPDFKTEMSKEFKQGTEKYSEGLYNLLGFEGYDKYLENRKTALEEISNLQQSYLDGTDKQITKEEVLLKIDQQLLEDARTQSWLKIDLLEQMKNNTETYIDELKTKYDELLESEDTEDTELAKQVFEEYNNMLSTQMQIENQINQAIKQRYDTEFVLMNNKSNKEKQLQNNLQKNLKLFELQNSKDFDIFININKEIIESEKIRGNIIKSNIKELEDQLNLLKVGSYEWNIINNQIESFNLELKDSNIALEEIRIKIEKINLDKAVYKYTESFKILSKEMSDIDFQLKLVDEEDINAQIVLIEKAIIAKLNEINKITESIMNINLDNPDLTDEQRNELLKEWNEDLKNATLNVNDLEKSLKVLADKQLDKVINVEHKIIEIICKRIDEEKRLLNESLNEYEKYMNEKIRLINEETEEEDYAKSFKKEQEEALDIQKQINILMLDDSLEARNKERDLKKQLADKEERIEDMRNKRQKDKRIKNIQDLIEAEKDRVNNAIEQLDRQLENESLYTEARRAIQEGYIKDTEGNIVKIENAYILFEDRFGEGISLLGSKIKSEFIANLELAQQEIYNLHKLIEGLPSVIDQIPDIPEIPNVNPRSSDDPKKDAQKRADEAERQEREVNPETGRDRGIEEGVIDDKYHVFGIKFNKDIDPNTLDDIKVFDSSGKLINSKAEVGDNNKTVLVIPTNPLASGKYLVVIEGVKSADGKLTVAPFEKEFVTSYDTGGYTGKFGSQGKLGVLHEKELVLNKHDTDNLLKTIDITKNLFNKISMPNISKIKSASQQLHSQQLAEFKFDKLINIEGNVDKNVLPKFERLAEQTVKKLNEQFNRKGILRGI